MVLCLQLTDVLLRCWFRYQLISPHLLRPLKEDEVMPAKFDDDLIWVAADAPVSDSTFLSSKIKDLCGDLPIFWLRPTYATSKKSRGPMVKL